MILSEEQINNIREIQDSDEIISSLKQLKIPLQEEKSQIDSDLESIREQFKNINLEKELCNNLTEKGTPTPAELFIEKKKKVNQLQSWFFRARKSKEYKTREEREIRKKLAEINRQIKERKEFLVQEMIKNEDAQK